jgi:predicted ATP-grasp superfamily ATP-dependent carboligase
MSIFLTNAESPQALAALRGLGGKKIEINCGGSIKNSLCFYSPFCKKKFLYPSPNNEPNKFIGAIINYLKKNPTEVLMPIGLETFTLFSKYKEILENYTRVPVVDYKTFVKAHDKKLVIQRALKLKIPAPFTFTAKNLEDLDYISKKLGFPLIIKARKGTSTEQVFKVNSKSQAIRIFKIFKKKRKKNKFDDIIDYSDPIFQEFLPGDSYDALFLFNKGEMKSAFTQKRVLTYPVLGGSGVLNQSCYFPKLIKYGEAFLSDLNWHGVAMVEYKLDKFGEPRLIEVNPKFWGTLALSISAGINFPYRLYKMTLKGKIESFFNFKVNKIYGWPFPLGIKNILKSKKKLTSLKWYLKLLTQSNTTDLHQATSKELITYFLIAFKYFMGDYKV